MSAHPKRRSSALRSPRQPQPSPRRRSRAEVQSRAQLRGRASDATAQRQRQRQRGVALEMGILISVNIVVIAAASTAIVKLIPYNLSQRSKLDVLQAEVDSLVLRVDGLRQTFSHHFDAQRHLATQRELGNMGLPGQRLVRFVDPPHSPAGPDVTPATDKPAPVSR